MNPLQKKFSDNSQPSWQEKLRQAAASSVTEADIVDIFATVVKKAKEGDMVAVKVVCDFFLGGKGPTTAIQNNLTVNRVNGNGKPGSVESLRKKIVSYLTTAGEAEPDDIADELNISIEKVQIALDHPWFIKSKDGVYASLEAKQILDEV